MVKTVKQRRPRLWNKKGQDCVKKEGSGCRKRRARLWNKEGQDCGTKKAETV